MSLSARGNFTYTKNKVTEYDEIPQVYKYQQYTGQSIGQPLLYIAEGLYTPDDFNITTDPHTKKQTYKLKEGLPVPGAVVAPGDIKYKDLNGGDGVIDTYDRTYDNGFYPSSSPGIVYGFGLNAEWKGFNVGVFFQGTGNVSANLLNKAENFVPFLRGLEQQSVRTEGLDRWRSKIHTIRMFFSREYTRHLILTTRNGVLGGIATLVPTPEKCRIWLYIQQETCTESKTGWNTALCTRTKPVYMGQHKILGSGTKRRAFGS